jgi:arginine/ornithine N-succinyltransferase beta subunit
MARTKAVAELTIEQQIAQIQKEAAEKIKQLQNALPWNKRFQNAFQKYVRSHGKDIIAHMTGYKPESGIETEINDFLRDVNLSIKYDSATFDNSLYNQSAINDLVDQYDLSEYPVYTVFAVLEDKEIVGYVQINCQYSSYNGNEYNNFYFVKPKEITCTVFTAYNP